MNDNENEFNKIKQELIGEGLRIQIHKYNNSAHSRFVVSYNFLSGSVVASQFCEKVNSCADSVTRIRAIINSSPAQPETKLSTNKTLSFEGVRKTLSFEGDRKNLVFRRR